MNVLNDPATCKLCCQTTPNVGAEIVRVNDPYPVLYKIGPKSKDDKQRMNALDFM
jgi:hypothetical protein